MLWVIYYLRSPFHPKFDISCSFAILLHFILGVLLLKPDFSPKIFCTFGWYCSYSYHFTQNLIFPVTLLYIYSCFGCFSAYTYHFTQNLIFPVTSPALLLAFMRFTSYSLHLKKTKKCPKPWLTTNHSYGALSFYIVISKHIIMTKHKLSLNIFHQLNILYRLNISDLLNISIA